MRQNKHHVKTPSKQSSAKEVNICHGTRMHQCPFCRRVQQCIHKNIGHMLSSRQHLCQTTLWLFQQENTSTPQSEHATTVRIHTHSLGWSPVVYHFENWSQIMKSRPQTGEQNRKPSAVSSQQEGTGLILNEAVTVNGEQLHVNATGFIIICYKTPPADIIMSKCPSTFVYSVVECIQISLVMDWIFNKEKILQKAWIHSLFKKFNGIKINMKLIIPGACKHSDVDALQSANEQNAKNITYKKSLTLKSLKQ